jgi:hypothetical protein
VAVKILRATRRAAMSFIAKKEEKKCIGLEMSRRLKEGIMSSTR